jgi:hypothetical protein
MSDTGKQSPLGVNALNGLINVEGLNINPKFVSWAGSSSNFPSYSPGKLVTGTVLRLITYAIHEAYGGNPDGIPYNSVYNNLISIGGGIQNIPITSIKSGVVFGTDQFYFDVTYSQTVTLTSGSYVRINGANPSGYDGNWLVQSGTSGSFRVYSTASYGDSSTGTFSIDTQVPGLGNAKPLVYTWEELVGRFGTGTFNLNDTKGWGGSTYKNNIEGGDPNPATQWAYLRLLPLQAWMEFNYNSTLEQGDSLNPSGYRDFVQQMQTVYGFVGYSNNAILAVDNSKDFLSGTYTSMNDLITGDITNVSLATKAFGQDLIALGKAIDLSTIMSYGLPSNLLKTLAKYNALTKNVSLAIIASGITVDVLGGILSNTIQPSVEQERNLYAAFYITVGETFNEVLVPLNCKTRGLQSLADLLDPKRMFPNSYRTLTVQLYNTGEQNGAQNAKIAFPIYDAAGSINADLNSSTILNQIGAQVPAGTPPIMESSNTADKVTIQAPVYGYGSYLSTIIPADTATGAGAFSSAIQQIRNITEVAIEKFAQVVTNIETMVGLNTNSNDTNLVPTNLPLRTKGRPKIALGSGPQGTYTMSDFFGCMSGLPYNGRSYNNATGELECGFEGIYNKLTQLATTKLFNIYHETYLAVTWQRAKMSIAQPVYSVNVQQYIAPDPMAIPPVVGQPRIDDWYYTITFGLSVAGGGYGRGTAPAPAITISPNNVGASASCNIGTDDLDVPGKFGRVKELIGVNFGAPYKYATTSVMQAGLPAQPTPPEEIITIQAPPIEMLPVQSNGNRSVSGQNTPGYAISYLGVKSEGTWNWPLGGASPGMNNPITGYINQANIEIDTINSTNRDGCQKLNDYWNSTGTQLLIEQRARQEGLKPPLDNPRQNFLSLFPTTVYTFVDSIPQFGKDTEPHMSAQTLENISNWNTITGQSIVGMMRENRNQDRLTEIGISLDNNISDKLSRAQQKVLIANGVLPVTNETSDVTPPATPVIILGDIEVVPDKIGEIVNDEFIITNPEFGDSVLDIGNAEEPGSFAGTEYANLIPPNLNSWYSSSTLMPSTYTVQDAIDEVVRCNCDCWQLA